LRNLNGNPVVLNSLFIDTDAILAVERVEKRACEGLSSFISLIPLCPTLFTGTRFYADTTITAWFLPFLMPSKATG
jgi:hypothetical protein